ncbi:MAG TPA: hypothetical protein VM369_01725, partial [Candidatus Binatia bacterium]|nr:hypothetical protein [Candidatus Binatia bacterium]
MTLRFTPFAAALLFAACAAQPRMQPAAAREMLAEAQTLLELTQLVGVAPAKCLPLARGNQMCTWEAPSTVP